MGTPEFLARVFKQAPELQLDIAFIQKVSLALVRSEELESDGCTASFGFAWLKKRGMVNADTISALRKACVTSQDFVKSERRTEKEEYERRTDCEIRRTRS